MTLSAWLREARAADGGLLIPGRPAHAACDLVLAPDGAHVVADELEVVLPYEDCGATTGDSWILTSWSATRGGDSIGAAVRGGGSHAAGIEQLRRRRRSFASWVNRIGRGRNEAPLDAAGTINARVEADLRALAVLCVTLARKSDWRAQLGDRARVVQLLRDMDAADHGLVLEKTGARRRTMETLIALRMAGYEHPVGGRPLPDDPPLDDEAVVAAVLHRLQANRYALPPDEAQVSAVVHREYLDVEPWPFAALMPTGDPPAPRRTT
ncbi:hypothetical protein [Cellulomonas sp. SG140]|uniref:hypothetical protein n=1 Tax=Cellulomonas sp. SG140 TaxID=2976536 RepID=UPI0021E80CA5|nr:hypothetical protein [Cellulomonas sp. SG140]